MVSAERPRLLLLHGFLATGVAWDGVRAALSGRADIVAPDLPGYGSAPSPRRYTLDGVLDALAPLVERERPTHVVGHSMGAIVALALAARRPAAFTSVGLVGLPAYESRSDALGYQRRRGWVQRVALQNDLVAHCGCVAFYQTRALWGPFSQLAGRRYSRAFMTSRFRHTRAAHADALDNIVFAGEVPALALANRGPVHLLHAARDRIAPLDRARALAEEHGWDFTLARGAGHQVILTAPQVVAGWIEERVLAAGGASPHPQAERSAPASAS